VIDAHRPGALDGWGLGFSALRDLQPTVAMVQSSPFGQDGPYAGYLGEEIVYYAMGGPMCSNRRRRAGGEGLAAFFAKRRPVFHGR